jgi:hypothetical protein
MVENVVDMRHGINSVEKPPQVDQNAEPAAGEL